MARGKTKIVTSYTKRGSMSKASNKHKLTTAGFKRGSKKR
jgi:hypothetical protein